MESEDTGRSTRAKTHRPDVEDAHLDEEVPDPVRFVYVDFYDVVCLGGGGFPPHPTGISLMPIQDFGGMRSWEQSVCSLGASKGSVGLFAELNIERRGCKGGSNGGEYSTHVSPWEMGEGSNVHNSRAEVHAGLLSLGIASPSHLFSAIYTLAMS